jgi:F0F1-type ATP synthase assembly protein I
MLSTLDMKILKKNNEYDDEIKQGGEQEKHERQKRQESTRSSKQYMNCIFLSYDFLFLK